MSTNKEAIKLTENQLNLLDRLYNSFTSEWSLDTGDLRNARKLFAMKLICRAIGFRKVLIVTDLGLSLLVKNDKKVERELVQAAFDALSKVIELHNRAGNEDAVALYKALQFRLTELMKD